MFSKFSVIFVLFLATIGSSLGEDKVTEKTDELTRILNKIESIEKRLLILEKQKLSQKLSKKGNNSHNFSVKSDKLLKVNNWSASPASSSSDFFESISVNYTIQNLSEKEIVLVDGSTVLKIS